MKIGFLLLTLIAISSCTESVLDPNELGKNGTPGTVGTDLVFYNQEVVNFAGGSPHILQSFSLTSGAIDVITQQGFMTAPPVRNKLLYIDDSLPGQHKLYISDLGGNDPQLIFSDGLIESATLSPDGNSILFTVTYEDPYRIPFSRIQLISIAAPSEVQIIADDGDPSVMPTFSPNGQHIAYAQLDPNGLDKLTVYTISTRSATTLGNVGLTPLSIDLEFDWTADSKQILCISNEDVVLCDITSGVVTPLGFSPVAGLPIFPVISPDGQIAAAGFDMSGGYTGVSDIYVYSGSGWNNITNSADSSEVLPHFSSDGKKLVFSAIAGGLDPFSTQAVPISTMKVYESNTTKTLDQGMIVRPLFGR